MNSKYFKIDAKLEKGAGVTPFYGTLGLMGLALEVRYISMAYIPF